MMPLLLKFAALFQLLLIATESDAISVLDYYEAQINGRTYNVSSTICRDVSIIGGGSAGCYSAVHLRDYNQSVVVIEQQDRLGGHTQTYTDPTTGKHVELGVQIFYDTDVVKNYFSRFNIPTFLMNITGSLEQKRLYYDFVTNTGNASYSPYGSAAFAMAYEGYVAQLQKYPSLEIGYNLPTPVPSDLLLSFQGFVEKYSLGPVVPMLWLLSQGFGNLLEIPTLYVLKLNGLSLIQGIETGFLYTEDNSALYESITSYLGQDVLFESTVLDIERNNSTGIRMVVSTPNGLTLVESQKLIISVQPTAQNLAALSLTQLEGALLSQFTYTNYFAALLNNTGLPANISLLAYDPTQTFGIPAPPSIYDIQQTNVEGVFRVDYGTAANVQTTDAEIESAILSAVEALNIPGKVASTPNFVMSSNHKPFELRASASAIANGLYNDLNAMQGEQNTWWISATFQSHDSSLIWEFAETFLPEIAAA